MVNETIVRGLHQQVKDIMKRDMTISEVQQLINWHCDVRSNDYDMIIAQLVTLKRMGKIQ